MLRRTTSADMGANCERNTAEWQSPEPKQQWPCVGCNHDASSATPKTAEPRAAINLRSTESPVPDMRHKQDARRAHMPNGTHTHTSASSAAGRNVGRTGIGQDRDRNDAFGRVGLHLELGVAVLTIARCPRTPRGARLRQRTKGIRRDKEIFTTTPWLGRKRVPQQARVSHTSMRFEIAGVRRVNRRQHVESCVAARDSRKSRGKPQRRHEISLLRF